MRWPAALFGFPLVLFICILIFGREQLGIKGILISVFLCAGAVAAILYFGLPIYLSVAVLAGSRRGTLIKI